jgi:hypothetical protein
VCRRGVALLAAALAATALAAVAAGCGGGEAPAPEPAGEGAAPSAEEGTTAPAREAEVVRFGDKSTVVQGFFDGQSVEYLDFGPVELAEGNAVARSGR